MMPIKSHLLNVLKDAAELETNWDRVRSDFDAGRIDVMNVRLNAQAAMAALDAGDEAQAALLTIEALAAWGRALEMQMPAKHRAKLSTRPEVGGRADKQARDLALFTAACEADGKNILDRCKAAIAADELLKRQFLNLSDDGIKKAYTRGKNSTQNSE